MTIVHAVFRPAAVKHPHRLADTTLSQGSSTWIPAFASVALIGAASPHEPDFQEHPSHTTGRYSLN